MFFTRKSAYSVAKTISDGLESGSVVLKARRVKWEHKKSKLRFRVALLFTMLSFIAFELSSPGYSYSEMLTQYILDSKLINLFSSYSIVLPDTMITPFVIKLCLFYIYMHFSYAFIILNDPLSKISLDNFNKNHGLIRNHWWDRIVSESQYYLESSPPSRMIAICAKCVHVSNCNNSFHANEIIMRNWWKIFSCLGDDVVNSYLEKVHKCRAVVLYKYSSLLLAFICVLTYLLARIFELFIGLDVNLNLSVLVYSFIAYANSFIISWLNPYSENAKHGVWYNHRVFVNDVIMKQEVLQSHVEQICNANE